MSEVEWESLQSKKAEVKRQLAQAQGDIATAQGEITAAQQVILAASKSLTDGAAKISKLADDLRGIQDRENTMIARENANLDFFDPPQEWVSDGSSPTFSQVLADLGAGGGIGQESSCP
jgi:chromosome segregation ATPase